MIARNPERRLPFRLHEELVQALDRLAAEGGTTQAAQLRRAVEIGLLGWCALPGAERKTALRRPLEGGTEARSVSVRLPEELVQALDRLVAQGGTTRATELRRAVEIGLLDWRNLPDAERATVTERLRRASRSASRRPGVLGVR